MAISRLSTSRLTQGLPKYQSAWDQDNVQQGALVPISHIISNGTSASMTFSNIPQIYRDLKVIVNGRSTHSGGTSYSLYFNNSGTSGWSMTRFFASSTTASTDRLTQSSPTYGFIMETGWNNTAAGIFNASEIDIFNYSSAVTFKSIFGRNAFEQGTSGLTEMNIGTWANNSAITSIDVATNTGWYPGSTATLYGIKAGA